MMETAQLMQENKSLTQTDPTGLQTLEQFAEAKKFNQWLFETLLPYCKGKILEAGSGIGNISELLLQHKFHLTVSDLREEYCTYLSSKFNNHPLLDGVVQLDLSVDSLETEKPELIGQFDTVITSNVIEHIEDDVNAIRNCKKMLAKHGNLIILVPAFQSFYNGFDKELGHYRRYSAKKLSGLMQAEGMQVIHTQYFNTAGLLGWFFSGAVMKKKVIPNNQLQLFEKLVPVVRLIDKLTLHKAGLSVIAVARKQ